MKGLPEACTEIDSFLRREGFKCREVETEDMYSRWCYYFREFRRADSNVMLRLVLRFDLQISDSPVGSYDDNHDLFYEDCYIEIYDRQMLKEEGLFDGEHFYDEDSELLRKIDRYPICTASYSELKQLMCSL